jgi:hypothetical protein
MDNPLMNYYLKYYAHKLSYYMGLIIRFTLKLRRCHYFTQ